MKKITLKTDKIMRMLSARSLSIREFAFSAGIASSSLTAWLRGSRNPKLANVEALAKALKCDINDIADTGDDIKTTTISAPEKVADTIQNTTVLRECIKDAMMRKGVTDAVGLKKIIGYDSANTIERLLSGKINFFPDILSAIFDALDINQEDAPITPAERELLHPQGIFNAGAVLTRPMPVIDWANAATHLGMVQHAGNAVLYKWDPETTETIPAPIGFRKETFAFRIYGESMEPTINDNEIIFSSKAFSLDEINQNDIVVVMFNSNYDYCPECVVCKRYRKVGDTILLTSDNRSPESRDFELTAADISWIGFVVSKVTTFRR